MPPIPPRIVVQSIALATAIATSAPSVSADEFELARVELPELKSVYLWCERTSSRIRLPAALIARCSLVYEELKQRAFDGDWEKLLAWSRSQSAALSGER